MNGKKTHTSETKNEGKADADETKKGESKPGGEGRSAGETGANAGDNGGKAESGHEGRRSRRRYGRATDEEKEKDLQTFGAKAKIDIQIAALKRQKQLL